MALNSGWNLISIPIDKNISDFSIFGNYKSILNYKENSWIENTSTLNYSDGFWINMNRDEILKYVQNNYSWYIPECENLDIHESKIDENGYYVTCVMTSSQILVLQ